ncbi:hypothetical protein ACLMJK_001903 [Lecanora helva]
MRLSSRFMNEHGTHSSFESHLVVSVDAVGLAFLTFQSSYSQVPQAARAKYLDALSLLKHELVSPSSSLSDATLLTVLLLDLFEKINGNNPQSTEGWMSHVDGALALMRLRGQENVRNHTALRLSMRLSTNLIISSLAANHRVPLEVIRLRAEVEPFINADDPKWRLSGLTVKYANLRGSMQEGSLSDADILTQSKDLDMEFVLLAKSVPPSWMYQSVYPAKVSERFFESHYDTYRDHLVTQTWNVLRAMRIFLNDTLRTSSQRNSAAFCELDPNIPSEEYSSAIIDTMAKEICATTAQYTTCTEAKSKSIEIPAVETLRCYTIIFPLYTAGLYASEQTGIKPWVVKELRFMGNGIGIRNANLVADVLERGDGTSPWSVYAMTGSYAFAA